MEIQTGFQKTKVGLIPSDWDIENILKNSTMKARIGWQGLTVAEYLDNGEYFLITGTDFFSGKIKWDTCHYVNKKRYEQDKNIQIREGDILITKDGTIGKVGFIDYLPQPTTLNSGVFVIRPKKAAYIPLYLFCVFNSHYFREFLNKLSAGSTINHLYQKDFVSFDFPIPPTKTEQTAIATALNDADTLIAQLEKLITKKRNIKQGAMQELLTPKEGWGVERLGLIAVLKKGQLITEKTATLGNVPVIGGGMSTSYYHNEPNRKANTVTISASGANAGYVSFHVYPIFASDCTTIENSAEYDVRFLYFTLLSKQKEIFKLQTGGAQPHVYPEQLRDLEISIPKEKEEQTKVVQILIDMDAEIDALEKKLEKYKMIKQGMMQNLLTGMIRLL